MICRIPSEHWRFAAPVAWVPGGNSLKQEEARDLARAALSAIGDPVGEIVGWLRGEYYTLATYDEVADHIQAKWGGQAVITDEDRKAAAKLIGKVGLSWTGDMIREGRADHHAYVQAFARHRELGRRQGLEEAARACEAERVNADETEQADDYAYNRAIEHCAAAIRKLGADK